MKKALLVEDVKIAEIVAKRALEKSNMVVTTAASGEEALQHLREEKFDIIFLDLGLPDMGGFDVMQKMKEENTINKSTPVVILTAHDDEEYLREGESLGISGYLVKPINNTKLQDFLQNSFKKNKE